MAKKAELDLFELPEGETGPQEPVETERDAAPGPVDGQEQPLPPGDGNKVPLFRQKKVLIPASLLLLLSLSFLLFQLFRGPAVPSPEAVSPSGGDKAVSAGGSPWVTFRNLIVPLKDPGDRKRLLLVDVAVEIEPRGGGEGESWMRDRRDDLYRVIQDNVLPAPVSAAGRKTLKETIQRSLSPHFGPGRIMGIYFTRFYYI
ncbi:MAG TPA: flagellar basal body-associated FliL family protein [Syntrophales bacterium]|nr:flagellar basal body-associated FliL family protein [Syntrophales bacterium]HQB29478.1 flagellar basal body-associated FliL family protein [Syntrophales bacterium]